MPKTRATRIIAAILTSLSPLILAGCKSKSDGAQAAAATPPFMSAVASAPPQMPDGDTPPPEKTGGFDGKLAFAHVAKQVGFGPRPSGSQAIAQTQDYILSQLSSFGCTVEIDNFNAQTPAGTIPMKNILVKIPGDKPGILLLATHYDTKRLDDFVGADDAGSSTGVMLELARLFCARHNSRPIWIAFLDGEEAVNREWRDPDNRYGSRELAATLAMSGDLPKVKAFLLADIVGTRTPRFKRESNSTPELTNLFWSTAARLGYSGIFVQDETAIEDDHLSFSVRKVPTLDVIDLEIPYWHTPQDSLDKISSKTLAIVGHVFVEGIKQLQAK